MHISSINPNCPSQPNFGRVYVASEAATKMLKQADRLINAKSPNTIYLNVNIPQNHRKPLWSVFFESISQRQSENPNNIIIDVADKKKKLLSVTVTDKKGFDVDVYTASPFPNYGGKNNFIKTGGLYKQYIYSLDTKTYGISDLLEVMAVAEYKADKLLETQLTEKSKIKTSLKACKKAEKYVNMHASDKHKEKIAAKIIVHVQRPFEKLKELLLMKTPKTAVAIKKEQTAKTRIPRKLKKQYKKSAA